jgi:hypothetical protein
MTRVSSNPPKENREMMIRSWVFRLTLLTASALAAATNAGWKWWPVH